MGSVVCFVSYYYLLVNLPASTVALITLLTPVFLDEKAGIFKDNPWPIFAFFAGMMVLQLLFAIFLMTETKGLSLEELKKKFVKE